MKAPVRAGDLRTRIVIEMQSRQPDGQGGWQVTWTQVAQVWAGIWPRSASEDVQHDRPAGSATHDVWVRYRADIKPEMRLVAGARTFGILGVMDVEDRKHWLKCIVEERDL
jgi:SPP1 family predicted phage head-tail adaptor